jgi:hypothetical protein
MSSLTQTAILSRNAIKIFALLGAVLLILFMVFMIGRAVVSSLFPKAQLPATVAFNTLPPYVFGGVEPLEGAEYSLETISGGLPLLLDKAKVFGVSQPEPSFGARERIIIRAGRIGFSAPPEEPSSGVLRFTDTRDGVKSLLVDVFSDEFSFNSDYLENSETALSRPSSESDAVQKAAAFFRSYGFDMSDFPASLAKAQKLKFENGGLTDALSLSETNIIKVSFSRKELGGMPVFWPSENSSEIVAYVSQRSVVAAEGNKLQIQKYNFSTYPLKGVVRAYEDLRLGKAAYNRQAEGKRIPIINVSLGYVENVSETRYLMPVYLFEGPDNFVAYVGAVDDKWITE